MNSESPSQKPPQTEGSNRPANHDSGETQPKVPPAVGSTKTHPPPSPYHYEIACKTKRDWLDKIKFGAELLGLGVLIAYTTFAALQWCEMRKAAEAATNANILANQSMTQNLNNFRLDQRAWVGVDNVVGVPAKGQPFVVTVVLKNTGKTPAKNVRPWKHSAPHAHLPDVQSQCRVGLNSGPLKSAGYFNPGGTYLLVFNPSREPLQQELETIIGPGKLFYVYGCVTYDDVSGNPHWLTYCSFWDAKSKGYAPCEKYNDTGDGYPPQ